jgi:hypothetical protein
MTDEQIIKQAIEKANYVSRETNELFNLYKSLRVCETVTEIGELSYRIKLLINSIIFSHEFAKAFVRYILTDECLEKVNIKLVKKLGYYSNYRKKEVMLEIMKNNFLQQLVILPDDERIKYLGKFL